MKTKAYYPLIQYCPDAGRTERVNIGIALFCPERSFLDALGIDTYDRPVAWFGEQARGYLSAFWASELHYVQSLRPMSFADYCQALADRSGNNFRFFTRPMTTEDPKADLIQLFRELVEVQK